MDIIPSDYKSLAFRMVNDLMLKSPATMISATAITALWSAGRGMFSVARGLNRVNGGGKKHWYVFNRLICCRLHRSFAAVCIMSMGLLVIWTNASEIYTDPFSFYCAFNRLCGSRCASVGLWESFYFLPGYLLPGAGSKGNLPEHHRRELYFPQRDGCSFICIFSCILNMQVGKTILICTAYFAAIALSFVALYLYVHPVYGSGAQLVLG